MQAEKPATGILKSNDWGDSVTYHIECDCTDPEHAQLIDIEAQDDGFVEVIIYSTTSNDTKRNRFSLMWELLWKGYIKTDTSIILKEQAALNYAETLKSAIEDVRNFKSSTS